MKKSYAEIRLSIYKILFWILIVVLPFYLLAPTLLNLKDKREEAKQNNQTLPWYLENLPQSELNLGLDLRGGLYMELDVDLKEAIKHQVNFRVNEIQKTILADNFKNVQLTTLSSEIIRVNIPADKRPQFLNALRRQYGPEDFAWAKSKHELFFDISGLAANARKLVLGTLNQNKNFTGGVFLSSDKKVLSVSYFSSEEKSFIETSLQSDTFKDILSTKDQPNDISYLNFTENYIQRLRKDTLSQAKSAVTNRIDRYGVAEAAVSVGSTGRLIVELPGIKDPSSVIKIIKKTGKLEFRLVSNALSQAEVQNLVELKKTELKIDNFVEEKDIKELNKLLSAELPENTEIAFEIIRDTKSKEVSRSIPYLLTKTVFVTGDMLDNARVDTNQSNTPVVAIAFNKAGTQAFGKFTKDNVSRISAIVLDGQIMSTPQINEAILGGQATITLGRGTYQTLQKEAQDLVLILKEGSLPASLTIATKNIIGPSLGKESIDKGIKSLLIAACGIMIFMLLYYKVGGIVANIALFLNVSYIFAALCLFGASLTLPGIAGIVLTLGMAVDANVIIFERMREEIKRNKDVQTVVENGYGNAMSAIIDGNITTFIAGIVLFTFGTGPIKGFATTLMIGILTTLLCSVLFTRTIYNWLAHTIKIKKLRI